MGKVERIYINGENGVYCTKSTVEKNYDIYNFIETPLVYDIDTKQVFDMPVIISIPTPYLGKNSKPCLFTNNRIIEIP